MQLYAVAHSRCSVKQAGAAIGQARRACLHYTQRTGAQAQLQAAAVKASAGWGQQYFPQARPLGRATAQRPALCTQPLQREDERSCVGCLRAPRYQLDLAQLKVSFHLTTEQLLHPSPLRLRLLLLILNLLPLLLIA